MPGSAKANEIKSARILNRENIKLLKIITDTLPSPVKPAEAASAKPVTEKPVATVIKEVPKARKVAVPKPVTVKVKPVKIIKPTIIKPVLKVL